MIVPNIKINNLDMIVNYLIQGSKEIINSNSLIDRLVSFIKGINASINNDKKDRPGKEYHLLYMTMNCIKSFNGKIAELWRMAEIIALYKNVVLDDDSLDIILEFIEINKEKQLVINAFKNCVFSFDLKIETIKKIYDYYKNNDLKTSEKIYRELTKRDEKYMDYLES